MLGDEVDGGLFDDDDNELRCSPVFTYLGWGTAVTCAFDVATAVVGELHTVRRLVQEDGSLQIQ